MNDILILFFAVAVGFLLGWRTREWYASQVVKKYLKNYEDSHYPSEPNDKIMNVYLEVDRGNFYIYDYSSKAFITQVKTKEEMFDYFSDKYPDKTVMMKREHLDMFDVA
jgi:hypothetical protein